MTAHQLDHVVLPTASLDVARRRLDALGFTVAPKGVHPFGTENCCVYLSDGTFMEPLAVADSTVLAAAVAAGNVFVARDQLCRAKLGDEGFSAVVFGTGNADADHARYVKADLSAGDMLSFSRPFVDAAGKSDIASFKLAFAAGQDTGDAFLFACERVNAPRVDRTALQRHANGVRAIGEIVAVSDAPERQKTLLSVAANALPNSGDAGQVELALPNAKLSVLDPAAFEARFRLPSGQMSPLRFAAIVFETIDIQAVRSHLGANAVIYDTRGGDVVVPPAPGQGAAFIFKEFA